MAKGRRSCMAAVVALITSSAALNTARAGGPVGNEIIQVPLRWCAMQGSTAAANPGAFGEPDTDGVLWRRHERATDQIWTPGANLTFRSAVTAAVLTNANFPIINDPNAAASGGPGALGDIVDPQINNAEWSQTLNSCTTAWNNLAASLGTPILGPIAVNINRFVDNSGNPTGLWGWGGFSAFTPASANLCSNPQAATSAQGGSIVVVDFSVTGTGPLDARLVAHELGHVLRLGHGNGLDDDANGVFDDNVFACDAAETSNTPASIMHPTIPSAAATVTTLQRATSRAISRVYSGAQIDPPAQLVNAETLSDQRSDVLDDVSAASVDLSWVSLVVNSQAGMLVFTHALLGIVPRDETNQYAVFADLDADATTGGAPAKLGFQTAFQGAELVARVVVEPARRAVPTLWRFDGVDFIDVTDRGARAAITSPRGGEAPIPMYDVVSLELPLEVAGAVGPRVRLQAIAQQLATGKDLDVLPGGPGEWPEASAVDLGMVPPRFPVCAVTPDQAEPGDTVTVEATDFGRADEPVHVVLGDLLIAQGVLDENGTVAIDFTIPAETRRGLRLITVGVDGTALTADCAVQIGRVGQERR